MPTAVCAALAESAREGPRREKPRATISRKGRRERHCSSVGDLGRLGDDLVETVSPAAACNLYELIAILHLLQYVFPRPLGW
jgi:hypothetical protein